MQELFYRYKYETIAAVAGAVVMILELVGARMIAPFFGTSLYVWTAIIGVILAALSFGYWFGGKIADRSASDTGLMKIIVLSALCIAVTMIVQDPLLNLLASSIGDVRISALFAALFLFAPAALLLGVVSPYIVKLRLASLETAGAAVGRLSAAGTLGSILGTFAAGYWLISWFGNRTLGIGLVIALILLSLLVTHRGWLVARVSIVVIALLTASSASPLAPDVIADIDSSYARYLVTETKNEGSLPVRSLIMDPDSTQSAQYIGNPDLLIFGYTRQFMKLAETTKPSSMLVIGGGAFTFPLAAARAFPDTDVSVVEIDPILTDISKKYFSLTERSNLHIINADGRVYLNQADAGKKFDIIYMDAFSSMTPPYQLATSEAVENAKRLLTPNGIVVVNIIATASETSPYLSGVMTTYRQHFDVVTPYQYPQNKSSTERQNLLIVASNDTSVSSQIDDALDLSPITVASSRLLTDDHAPVEQLTEER